MSSVNQAEPRGTVLTVRQQVLRFTIKLTRDRIKPLAHLSLKGHKFLLHDHFGKKNILKIFRPNLNDPGFNGNKQAGSGPAS